MSVEVKLINKRGYKITPEKACKILKRKMDKEGIGDRMKECRYYTPDSEGIPLKTENITKFRLFFKNVDLLDGVAELLEKNFPVSAFTCEAASSHKELAGQNGFVEIIPRELGKSHAIDVLRRRESIPLEDIVTVGDGPNDYEMVRDYNGYAIKGSKLNSLHHQLKTTDSVKSLVEQLLGA